MRRHHDSGRREGFICPSDTAFIVPPWVCRLISSSTAVFNQFTERFNQTEELPMANRQSLAPASLRPKRAACGVAGLRSVTQEDFTPDKTDNRAVLPVHWQEKTGKNCLSMVEPQEKSADAAQRNRECEKPACLW